MRYPILLAFLCFFSITYSQSYAPIPTDSVYWIEGSYGGGSVAWNRIVVQGDTIINGQTYHVLIGYLSSQMNALPSSPNPFMPITRYPAYHEGYFRNDSVNKKVYFKRYPNSNEVLLYDFDLILNQKYPDTYLMDSLGTPGFAYRYRDYYVDSISTASYFGNNRNVYHLVESCLGGEKVDLIEGVGASSGFLNMMFFITLGYDQFSLGQCWKGLNRSLIPCSLFLVGEDEKSPSTKAKWEYHYDHLNGRIIIDGKRSILQISIFTISGQRIGLFRPESNAFNVNLERGIYLLQAIDEKGNIFSGKLPVN